MAVSSRGGSDPQVELYKKDCELVRESCQLALERKAVEPQAAETVAEHEKLYAQKENIEKFAQTIFTFSRQLNDRYQQLSHDLAKERIAVAGQERKAHRNPNESKRIKEIDVLLQELSSSNKLMQESVSAVRRVFSKLS